MFPELYVTHELHDASSRLRRLVDASFLTVDGAITLTFPLLFHDGCLRFMHLMVLRSDGCYEAGRPT
jgi:hypothetical protein